ncbi:MAG TPA: coagulation factor 5/8 type domain-containing protein [Solirubrobacteraceae bacterium]|nr:coagulation factor 5/8 type domain-containing protein [Solirubrobacteraceae bacterium]
MTSTPNRTSGLRGSAVWSLALVLGLFLAVGAAWVLGGGATHSASRTSAPGRPDLGPNVYVFTPGMPQSRIEATVNSIATRQAGNQFGTQRYSLLFEPGTYGSAANPLFLQVGYYTSVAGLGSSPRDVVINGAVDSFNQCLPSGSSATSNCTALDNFWRSLSNLTINVPAASNGAPCQRTAEFWATSQASPLRRVEINGFTSLMDYCSKPGYSSGGFIADSKLSGRPVLNGSQQQFLVRNTILDGWSNSVWNQVFSGDSGAPAQKFGSGSQYTTLAASPITEEAPFLEVDSAGNYRVFVPAVQHRSVGPSWDNGPAPGTAIPIERFFIATPRDPAAAINAALARGRDLILTPGVYTLDQTIEVTRPHTVVLGLGFPTLVPANGIVAMRVANVAGVKLAGMIFDAGPVDSPVLLQVGAHPGLGGADAADPTVVQDVFFRIGGAAPGQATISLVINSSQVILDDVWAWRADHGQGVGWSDNTGDTGVVVNGDDVTAYGLFVEHYEKDEVIWNGANGTDIFFQNEMPYDPPSQAAWRAGLTSDGYPAFLITRGAAGFHGYGMASYSFFDRGVPIFATDAFETADPPGSVLHNLVTTFLSSAGSGGIDHVVNGTGGSSTGANPDTAVDVRSYP